MKVALIGSRTFQDFELLKKNIQHLDITEIVSGGARGADSLAEKYARLNNIPIKIFLPDWKKHNKSAGVIRNASIIDYADSVIAFWDGKSKGTLDAINKCKKKNIPVTIVDIGG